MIKLHHLGYSRSLRVLWLLEELGLDYELISYERTKEFLAPPALAEIHPLGKSPVIVDGDLVLAESSAILRYVYGKYGSGTLLSPAGTDARAVEEEWLDYVESSAVLPVMITFLGKRTGGLNEGLAAFAEKQVAKTLAYIESGIGDGPFLMGERLTLADIQMSYLLAVADKVGLLASHPAIVGYLKRLENVSAFKRAVARGGPMMPPQ